MQKAWLYEEHGHKEVLKLGEIPIPSPQSNQILVQVHAAALNPIDFKLRENPLAPIDLPVVPGCDMAGVIIATGRHVSKFRTGDEIYGNVQNFNPAGKLRRLGTLAEFTVVDEDLAAAKPRNLSFEEAASLPVAVQTAVEGFRTASFGEGRSVFVVGGAGGVGSLAVQMAKNVYRACSVTATASTGKLEFVKGLGADKVVDYTKMRYEEVEEKYDLVYDTIGDSRNSYVVAKDNATVIDITWPPSNPKAVYSGLRVSGQILESLRPCLESSKLKPVIDPISPFHFTNVVQAFSYLETGRAWGKIVISPFPLRANGI